LPINNIRAQHKLSTWQEEKGKEILPQKNNNALEDLVGNEENEYHFPPPNRMMINMTSEFNDSHKKSLRGNHG
jgi:hypothetical protein